MSDHGITLPPLPNRALRPGAGDDAMTDYARAAVLLDRQQRPSVECPMCCAEVVRVAGAYDTPAPSAEPVLTVRRVDGEWVVAHCGQEDNFGKTLTINFDALGVVGCESLDKVQVQPTAPSAEPAIAVVTSSSSFQASISWTLNPLPVGTKLYASPPAPCAEPVKPVAWLAMHIGIPAQATTDEHTALGWAMNGGDVRPLYTTPPDHREAMRQALDALSEAITYVEAPSWTPSTADECQKAIDALRAALEGK
jgi:hypothetical protein